MTPNRRDLYVAVVLGLVARIVIWSLKGGFHYPDEIFQQVEPGFYLQRGFGWFAWEFERGVRSWVPPAFYAASLQALSWFGIEGLGAFRALTLHNALWSLLLIPAGYRIGLALFVDRHSDERRFAALLIAVLMAVLPSLVYFTPHTLIGTPSMIALIWGVVFWVEDVGADEDRNRLHKLGMCFGIAGALRFTSGFHMVIAIADIIMRRRIRGATAMLVGAALPVLVVGVVDWATWGSFLHSTIEHIRYNFFESGASQHGIETWSFYLQQAIYKRLGPLAWLTLVLTAIGARTSWRLILSIVVPTVVLSLIPHKEERFLMANWALLAACVGTGLTITTAELRKRAAQHWPVALSVLLVAAVCVSNALGIKEMPWRWRQGIFEAQSYVGGQPDATGLLLDDRQHLNGGYTVFNRFVPQVQFRPDLVYAPLFNYAAVVAKSHQERMVQRARWRLVATRRDINVWKRSEPAVDILPATPRLAPMP